MSNTAKYLVWLDLETDGFPTVHDGVIDYRNVNILEFAMIVTDNALNYHPVGGYSEVVKMTRSIHDNLQRNSVVKKMHLDNGLIADSLKASMTVGDIDAEVDRILSETEAQKGELAIAGSGVAAFDLPMIRVKMPKTAAWLAYYPYDIGIFRRMTVVMAGMHVINPQLRSYGESKVHRAMDDVQAHLDEAREYREWMREIPFYLQEDGVSNDDS